jgi:hypothetical protein
MVNLEAVMKILLAVWVDIVSSTSQDKLEHLLIPASH